MKFITASKLLVLPFLASINAVQAVEKDTASKVNSASSIQKKSPFLKDHRVLHQQKLNEFKKKARNLEGYSEETQKLLNCFLDAYFYETGSINFTFNKKDYLQETWTSNEECPENYKNAKQEYVYCGEAETLGAGIEFTEEICIPDSCPNDYTGLVMAVADALKLEGDDELIDLFSFLAHLYSTDKCVYPQCFATASEKFTFTTGFYCGGIYEKEFPPLPYSCPEIGGTCEVDCQNDDKYICIPELCYANKDYDADYVPPVEELDAVADAADVAHLGFGKRKLKATKSPKGSKAPKAKCTCKAPRNIEGKK
ncbi:predicted protein [Chaetoceros tenuissimus]|uniref:Uncharacterized protein n=1 Tax=Chaetoceros tenuissimus TaxID=426638 RepID=A0AAD3CWB4_9STRA|nr:predicted protein [Chaetoceros tenuissimus]